jgi:hypothetical protein
LKNATAKHGKFSYNHMGSIRRKARAIPNGTA